MVEEEKFKDIKKVYLLWLGGFIGSVSAMSQISDIMQAKYVHTNNASIMLNGKPIPVENVIVKYKRF